MNAEYKILVVDDNESGRYWKAHILKRAGYHIIEADNGADALSIAERERPALMLLDVKLPDISGIEVCRRLKESLPSTLILQTSADFTTKQDRAMGLAGGADSYLVEPLEPEELTATVSALLRLHQAEMDLRHANETLEEKVKERTREIAEINERLKAEISQRIEAEEIVRHTQKLDALGQLTGGIAHDFNNLLTIILGNLESLRRHLNQGSVNTSLFKKYVDNAFLGSQRAAGVTKRLLAFSRRQVLAPKTLNMNSLISGMSDLLRQTCGEAITVTTQLSDDLWSTFIDASQLEAAILNLTINARDAMPAGGSVTIATRNIDLPAGLNAGIITVDPGQYVQLTIADTGMGMSEDVKNYAFEPFFTTKGVGKGTGLGLSQVYGFVKQSEGQVVISSAVGQGTTIDIYLPRARTEQVRPAEAEAKFAPPTAGHETVLVVEDDESVRAHSAGILRELGYRVLEAHDGREALATIRQHSELALLFSDIGLPGGMSGYQLAEEALRIRPGLKILVTSGYADQMLTQQASYNPNVETLSKPFTFRSVGLKIADLLKRDDNGRILLVEDESLILLDTADALSELGFEVEGAGTVKDAFKAFSKDPSHVSAVIVDIGLPDGDGETLAMDIRAIRPDLPIILASGYGADGGNQKSLADDHLVAFLSKPYRVSELETVLRGFGIGPR